MMHLVLLVLLCSTPIGSGMCADQGAFLDDSALQATSKDFGKLVNAGPCKYAWEYIIKMLTNIVKNANNDGDQAFKAILNGD